MSVSAISITAIADLLDYPILKSCNMQILVSKFQPIFLHNHLRSW